MFKRITAFLMSSLLPLSVWGQTPASYSCMEVAEHRQFDFWAGQWRVESADGDTHYGDNLIEISDRGCVLRENWQGASGSSGSSINFYDPSDQSWHQMWVDSGASIIRIKGGLGGDSMVLEGHIFYLADQRRAPFRGSWTPLEDGRVRQWFEEQNSDGEWKTWFDGYYRRSGPVSTGSSR